MKRPILSFLLVLLLGLAAGVWYALNSQWGLNFAYQAISRIVPGQLKLQSLKGKLSGPFTLRGLDYVNDDIKLQLEYLQLDWSPTALFKGTLQLTSLDSEGLAIELRETAAPSEPANTTRFTLPLAIEVLEARLGRIAILSDSQQPIEIKHVFLQAEAREQSVQITQLTIESDMFDLSTEGTLGLYETHAVELHTLWTTRLPDISPLHGTGVITGSLAQLKLHQTINQPGINMTLQGDLHEIITKLNWELSLQVYQLDNQQLATTWPALSSQGHVTSSGSFDKFTLAGEIRTQPPGQGTLQADFTITATPAVWQLHQFKAKHYPTEARLQATGEWHPGTDFGDLHLTGTWQNLTLPLVPSPKTRQVVSQTGQFHLNGNLANYKFSADADLSAQQWPAMQLGITGNGNQDQVILTTLTAQTLEGKLSGDAIVRWNPGVTWETNLHAQNLNPATHWPDWPGRVSARLHALYNSMDAGNQPNLLELKNVTGQLRGYPLHAQGKFSWGPKKLRVDDFKLDVGSSKVRIAGYRDDNWNLQATLQSPDLNALCPYSRGNLTVSSRIAGPRSTPHIIANLSGDQIAFLDYVIGSISSDIDIDLQKDEQFTGKLSATQLSKGSQQWQSLTFNAAGKRSHHQLNLLLKQETDTILMDINAGLNEQQIWHGEITNTLLEVRKLGKWQQTRAAAFAIGMNQASLKPWCLAQPDALICLQGEREQAEWKAKLTAQEIPLGVIEYWLSPHLKLHGKVDIDSNLSYIPKQELTGALRVNIPSGFRLEVEDKEQSLSFGAAKLQATLDKTGLSTSMILPANEIGKLNAELNLPDWNALNGLYAAQPVNGHVAASITSLARLNGFFLDYPNLSGKLQTDFKVAGTLGNPRLIGETNLTQASAEIPALGIRLSEINLHARSETGKQLDYQLQLRSNKAGPLTVTGYTLLQTSEGWPSKLQIRGDKFQLTDLPDVKVKISPQLDVKVQGRRIDLNGSVTVPEARFRPRTLPQTSVSPSADVVILDEAELPVYERWKIYSQVRLILGDHVYFDGFGLRGELQGNVLLIDEPGKLTTGQGEISITEGTYKAYGQDAKIRRGRLMFANTVIENPGIDLEAVREVDTVTAGVRVRGTLKQPELTLFSEPAMAESDIISYFLLGRPMETTSESDEGQQLQKALLAARLAGGELIVDQTGIYSYVDEISFEADKTTEQTSLVVGKYLSPKLYVRYVTGIIESSNIVEIHYKLSRRLRIQTEAGYRSSSSITGADIYYTIEY